MKQRICFFFCVLVLAVVFPAKAQNPLTNEDVIKLVKEGLRDSTIIKLIEVQETRFNLSPDAVIGLKNAKVSQNVIEAMIAAEGLKRKTKASSGGPHRPPSPVGQGTILPIENKSGGKAALKNAVPIPPPVGTARKAVPSPEPPPEIPVPNLPSTSNGDPLAKLITGSGGRGGGIGTGEGGGIGSGVFRPGVGGVTAPTQTAPSQRTPNPPLLPTTYGFYVLDGNSARELVPVPVVARIGLTVGNVSGLPGIAVDGFAGDPPLSLETATPVLIVYQQLTDISGFHLANLKYVSTMQAFEFNMNDTAPQFFQNVYGRGYYDAIPVNLWRPQNESRLAIEPVEGKSGMYRLSPQSMLPPGRYAFYYRDSVHPGDIIFATRPDRRSSAFYFSVGQQTSAVAAPLPAPNPLPRFTGGVFEQGKNGIGFAQCISCPSPNYTPEARDAKIQGIVILELVVTPEGRAANISVIQGLGMGLTKQASEAVSRWHFRPASDSIGKPVAVKTIVQVTFKLS